MTLDAQALARTLAEHDGTERNYAWLGRLADAAAALDWVAANLHAEGDAGDALRERLGLEWVSGVGSKFRRLVGDWEDRP